MQNFLQWVVFISFVERLSTGLHLKSLQCINCEVFIKILKLKKSCHTIFGIFHDEYIVKIIAILSVKFRRIRPAPPNLPYTELVQKKQHYVNKTNKCTYTSYIF
jgi:hypothetical protein